MAAVPHTSHCAVASSRLMAHWLSGRTPFEVRCVTAAAVAFQTIDCNLIAMLATHRAQTVTAPHHSQAQARKFLMMG